MRVRKQGSLTFVIVLPDNPDRARNRLRSCEAIHIPPRAEDSKDPPLGIVSDPSRFVFIERDRLDVDLPNRVQVAENDTLRSRHRQQGGRGGPASVPFFFLGPSRSDAAATTSVKFTLEYVKRFLTDVTIVGRSLSARTP